MDETKHPQKPGYETSDVNVWAVGKFLVALIAITVVSLVLLLGLVKFFQSREDTSVANKVEPRKIFPQPQLQQTPVVDLQAIRVEEDQYLTSYTWVDQKKGVVKIPIDRAIDVLAQRGLPARAQSGMQGAASNVSIPTESGLGQKQAVEGDAPPPAAEMKSVVGPNKGQPEQVNTKEVQKK
ncbi:MAG: hypothetical protein JWP63_437 [Candidatus Solibacter sp.]|jgi:hypothetical protein|nr:hypothetical protein [Candidatus Solibacter sp.]